MVQGVDIVDDDNIGFSEDVDDTLITITIDRVQQAIRFHLSTCSLF